MKIAIIGGGPVGCFAGYLLAKDHQVDIYENHPSIGSPIQCTGILTKDFDKFNLPVEPFLVNITNTYKVYSPNKEITVNQEDYIVCRTKFDSYLANLAQKSGATIHLSHSFTRKEGKSLVIRNKGKEITITPDIVIAADGPLSPTAKAYGFYHKGRKNYYGVQAVVEGTFKKDVIETYFGNKVCPGLFAWVVPESTTSARVGLATTKDSKHYFDKFVAEHGYKIKLMQAGTIPIYNRNQKLQKGNCYLVGDASTYVKATTLGGIVPAMDQVKDLVNSINNGTTFNPKVKRKMWLHLQLSKILYKLNDKDWDRLLTYTNNITPLLEKYTRDNPFPIVINGIIKEPRLLYFIKYIF